MQACLNAFATACQEYCELAADKGDKALLDAIISGNAPIPQELYQRYASNLRRAVDSVPIDNPELAAQWQASVARFSAYKSFCAAQAIREAVAEDGDLELATSVLHAFNRYQAAEYNTAVARARTGKQWLQFSEPDNVRLFPNLKWLPSRSATPREEHMPFYNRVWPKDDPFWNSNQPGTLWNCKCDWEQTDEDPTEDNPTTRIVKPGLDENPAITGHIFTDTASYIRTGKSCVGDRAICRAYQTGARRETMEASKHLYLDNVKTRAFIDGREVQIGYNSTGISHMVAHDLKDSPACFLKNKILPQINTYLEGKNSVSSAENIKIEKKPNILRYHYFRLDFPGGAKLYLNVSESKNGDFVLYSITERIK